MTLEAQIKKLRQVNTAISRNLELLSMPLEPKNSALALESLEDLEKARNMLIEQLEREISATTKRAA
jgi:hypothetical protein